jgi:hypothetical protein
MMALRQNRKRTQIGEAELHTAIALRQEKVDARALKRQRVRDEKRDKEERSVMENNRVLQEQLDIDAAQLLKEQAVERATAKDARRDKKKQQRRGLQVAKEVKKRKDKATVQYNKVLADLEAQKEAHDVNILPKIARPQNRQKSSRKHLFANLSSNRVVAPNPVPFRWRDLQPRVTPEVRDNRTLFKKNESTEDSMRWMLGQHFNKRFVEKFCKWSGSTLIVASDKNLHHVGQDTSEVARLITLLEVQVKKAEEQTAVIDISGDDKAPSEGTVSQQGEYKFITLDNDYMSHPSRVEGKNKVRAATAFRRICGEGNFKNFTKVGEINFTADSVLEQIQKEHLWGRLNSLSIAAMTNEEADRSNKAFYYERVKSLPVFENKVVMQAMLHSEGNLMKCADPNTFSILSFSSVPGVLTYLGHTPDTVKVGHIVHTLQNLDYSYATLGGAVVWLHTTIQLRTWLESPPGGRVSPAFLLFKIHLAYNKFLELVSKAICSDPAIAGFDFRTHAGWKDLLISLLFEVTQVTVPEEEHYIRTTEKTFSWFSPEEQKKKAQKEDKKLGKAPAAGKKVCSHFLCGTLKIKDNKDQTLICTNASCQYEHLNLKNMKRSSALARIKTLPQSGRKTSIVAAAKLFQQYKT